MFKFSALKGVCPEESPQRMGRFRSRVHFLGSETIPISHLRGHLTLLGNANEATNRIWGDKLRKYFHLLFIAPRLKYVPTLSPFLHHLHLNSQQQPTTARSPLLAQPQRILSILLRPSSIARGVSQAAGRVFSHVTDALGRVA